MNLNRYWLSSRTNGLGLGLIEHASAGGAIRKYCKALRIKNRDKSISAQRVEEMAEGALLLLFDCDGLQFALQVQGQSRRYTSIGELCDALEAFYRSPAEFVAALEASAAEHSTRRWQICCYHIALFAASKRSLLHQLMGLEQRGLPGSVPQIVVDSLSACWDGDTVPMTVPDNFCLIGGSIAV